MTLRRRGHRDPADSLQVNHVVMIERRFKTTTKDAESTKGRGLMIGEGSFLVVFEPLVAL